MKGALLEEVRRRHFYHRIHPAIICRTFGVT